MSASRVLMPAAAIVAGVAIGRTTSPTPAIAVLAVALAAVNGYSKAYSP